MRGSGRQRHISNDSRFPVGLAPVNTDKVTLDDFMISSTSDKGVEFTNAYVDIDSLDEKAYKMFADMIENGASIKFFRYDTKPFIKDKVHMITSDKSNRKNEICIRLSNSTSTNGSTTVVYGEGGSGKTTLLNNIATQLKNKGVDVDFISNQNLDDINVVEKFKAYKEDILSRLKKLEQPKINNIYALDEFIQSKAIIIDDFDDIIRRPDVILHNDIDVIIDLVKTIINFGKFVGVTAVIASKSCVYNFDISNKIITGTASNKLIEDVMYKKIDFEIPIGSAMYHDTSELGRKFSIFSVNEVKDLM